MNKILLAEDDNDMRRFLAKALANAGYEVISYDNGASAYERLREEPFTLLLTDIVMPELDGIACIEQLMQLNPDVLILVVSALSDKATGIEALEKGARGFLLKPFTEQDINDALMELTDFLYV